MSVFITVHLLTNAKESTGGSSGIGYATSKILESKGARVFILDLNPPEDTEYNINPHATFLQCNIADWIDLRSKFDQIGHIDLAFGNAGVSEEKDYFADTFDEEGNLNEETYSVLDVNLRGTLNFIKLAWSTMKRRGIQGSIVITTSATAYAPEQSLPVYAGGKLAVSTHVASCVV